MKRLLISPKPFEDESLRGYILRLTYLNKYEAISWIYRQANLYQTRYSKSNLQFILEPTVDLRTLELITNNSSNSLKSLTFNNEFGIYLKADHVELFSIQKWHVFRKEN